MWFCAECGIEWRLDSKKKNMVYYQIDENGKADVIKKVSLRLFRGLKLQDGKKYS